MYKNVWAWAVPQHIEKGETVMCLDRKSCTVTEVNEMTWKRAFALLREAVELENAAAGEITRFEFWIEGEENE